MAKAGAPVGNQNAAKSKLVADALRKLVVQDDRKKFSAGLKAVMDAFGDGEPWAVQFVRDTLDGKPAQAVSVAGEDGQPLTINLVRFGGDNPT